MDRGGNVFHHITSRGNQKIFWDKVTSRHEVINEMLYKIFTDFVVLTHFLWILFLFLGAFLGGKNRVLKIFHLLGLSFALFIQIFDWYCPLTHLEGWLRSKHDPGLFYTGSFIIHYVERIVYIELSRHFILAFTFFLIGFNTLFYLKKGEIHNQC